MKRILLSVLSILLIFSLLSCDIDGFLNPGGKEEKSSSSSESSSSSSSSSSSEEEEEEEEEEESSSSSTSSALNPDDFPPLKPDQIKYSNEITSDGKWVYGEKELKAPVFTNYYHGYTSAISMTFDDGYDVGTGRYVSSIFKQYGFRGTMMLSACWMNDDLVPQWNDVFDDGYLDVGCHGYDHLNPLEIGADKYEHEIKDAIEFLREKFPSQRVLTFATPYAQINNAYEEYLNDYAISNRLEAGGNTVISGGTYNPYRVKSVSVLSSTTAPTFNQGMASALKQEGSWTVQLYHCVKDNASGRDATKQFFAEHCSYLYTNYKDTVWVASFEDVSIYLKQVQAAKISYIDSDRESMTISVTHDLDMDIYNFPMTVKLQVPSNVTCAYTIIDGEVKVFKASRGSGVNALVVKDIPVNSKEPIKIYFGGNDLYDNGCYHRYNKEQTVKAGCETHGYSVYQCVLCGVIYETDFIAPKGHDFSGERETVEKATLDKNGIDTIKCTKCEEKLEIETVCGNIAKDATISATDGVNEWVYVEDMVDENTSTGWTNGTNPTEISLSFDEAFVEMVDIDFSRYCDQSLVVSIYDGTEWTDVYEWDSVTDGNGESTHSITVDVNARIKGVKITFNGTSRGCTKVNEIGIFGMLDK